jgi:hypothetical protein
MRHARAVQRFLDRLYIAIGILFAIAIPVLCGRMLYVAYTDHTVLTLSRYVGWVTYQSHPHWFVISVMAYTVILALSLVWAIVIVASWRREHAMEQRRRTAPALDNAIRSDVNSR